jgi:archaellum component FlaC
MHPAERVAVVYRQNDILTTNLQRKGNRMDTLAYAKKLEAAGVPENQAEIQAEALAEVLRDQTVTRADLLEALQAFERRINIGGIKQDIEGVKQDIGGIKQDIEGVKQDIGGMKQDIEGVKQDLDVFKKDVRREFKDVRRDIGDIRHDMEGVKQDILDKLFLRLTGVISIATAILGILIGVFH